MGETANNSTHDPALEQPPLEQLPSAELPGGDFVDDESREGLDAAGDDFLDEVPHEGVGMAGELEAMYGGWLERRGIDPVGIPRLTMGRREFDLFRGAPDNYIGQAREIYDIPGGDQTDCQYAFVEVETGDPNLPPTPELMIVNEADFGTVIDFDRLAKDFEDNGESPDGPLRPAGTVRTVDISEAIADSSYDLESVTARMMEGQTVDPFDGTHGDIGIRAGEPGQKDAYVWTRSRITKSVELTIAFPDTYDSVCVVSGQMREAGNGKASMAQIDNPTVLLKIEGENLENLQRVYRQLYKEQDFAVAKAQRDTRDATFNGYVENLISDAANRNRIEQQAREDDERRRLQGGPKVRYLPR